MKTLLVRTLNSLTFPQNHKKFHIFPPLPSEEKEEYPPMVAPDEIEKQCGVVLWTLALCLAPEKWIEQ